MIGLKATFDQAFKARSAAEGAQDAISRIQSHYDAVSAVHTSAQLERIKALITVSEFKQAIIVFHSLKKSLRSHFWDEREDNSNTGPLYHIRVVGAQLNWASSGNGKFKLHLLNSSIEYIHDRITDIEIESTKKAAQEASK